jgi:hypothetical protein
MHLLEEGPMGGGVLVVVGPDRGHESINPISEILDPFMSVLHGPFEETNVSLRRRQLDPSYIDIILAYLHIVHHVLQPMNNGVDGLVHIPISHHHTINLGFGVRIVIIEELSQTTLALSFISTQRLVPTAPA